MFTLHSARLILASTPLDVMRKRLECDDFVAEIPGLSGHDGRHGVTFPPDWPGDALGLFPLWIAREEVRPDQLTWGGTMIDRDALVAVGQMSFKSLPDEHGTVELGYGVNASRQNRGYATEMARALVGWALVQPTVRRVTAECLAANVASIRVLEKVGFSRIGHRLDEEGLLLVWERRR